MAGKGRVNFFVILLVLIVLVAAGMAGVVLLNSPQQVAQKWTDALARGDGGTLKKLVVQKDEGRVSSLVNVTKMLPGMSAQLVGIEDQQGQKVAKIAVKFSQVTVGNFNLKLNGAAQLPFVLTREKLIFWRVDLEKSEPLIRQEVRRAVIEAIKQNPTLQQLLQFLPR